MVFRLKFGSSIVDKFDGRTRVMNRLYVVGILSFGLTLSGCFKKQGSEEKPIIGTDIDVTAVYDSTTPTLSYLKATAECGNFTSMLFVYSSEYTPSTEVRAECKANSQSGKSSISGKHLDIQNHTKCQAITVTAYGILRNQRSPPKVKVVNFCVPSPPTPGFAITSGGGFLSAAGMSAFVTIGEPIGGDDQTSATVLHKPGLTNQVYDPN